MNICGDLDHFQVGIGDTFTQALGKGEQQKNDPILLVGVKASDHAKVHQRQAPIIGVNLGMKWVES